MPTDRHCGPLPAGLPSSAGLACERHRAFYEAEDSLAPDFKGTCTGSRPLRRGPHTGDRYRTKTPVWPLISLAVFARVTRRRGPPSLRSATCPNPPMERNTRFVACASERRGPLRSSKRSTPRLKPKVKGTGNEKNSRGNRCARLSKMQGEYSENRFGRLCRAVPRTPRSPRRSGCQSQRRTFAAHSNSGVVL
jgi:hypothetical protein